MTFGFPSRVGCTVSQFIVFVFDVARMGPSALRMPSDCLYSTNNSPETVLKSNENKS